MRHTHDRMPGISREKKGAGWAYFDSDGKRITDRKRAEVGLIAYLKSKPKRRKTARA